MNVELFPHAEQELLDASEHYESKARGLGVDFVEEVERVCNVLLELQSLGEKLDPIHRRIPLRRFPFALIYRLDGETARIVAVAHRRRRPGYWQGRNR